MPELVTYRPEFRETFRRLNLAWIEQYFRVEQKDLDQVDRPETLREMGEIFFTLLGGRPVGTCAVYRLEEGVYEIAKMAVEPGHRGIGLGDLLMKGAEEWVRKRGGREIHILSNTVLEPAIALYRKHGYHVHRLGRHPDYERCNIELRKAISFPTSGTPGDPPRSDGE
jgi:GNAT superfamily N-acetyltransferase